MDNRPNDGEIRKLAVTLVCWGHNGAGELLVFSAADFEDFRQPRPDTLPEMEPELEEVVRILAQNRWPWRLHATYDETISRALDEFERVNQDIPLEGLRLMSVIYASGWAPRLPEVTSPMMKVRTSSA